VDNKIATTRISRVLLQVKGGQAFSPRICCYCGQGGQSANFAASPLRIGRSLVTVSDKAELLGTSSHGKKSRTARQGNATLRV
jgi:hypothetical protein